MKRNYTSNLYRLRVLNGLSQQSLAQHLSCSQSLYSLIETGKHKPSDEIKAKLKSFYHLVNEDDLF